MTAQEQPPRKSWRPGAETTDCCGLAWTYAHNPKAGTAPRGCGCEDCADGLIDYGYSVVATSYTPLPSPNVTPNATANDR